MSCSTTACRRYFAAVRILPATAEVVALATRERVLPTGTTGWVVKPGRRKLSSFPLMLGLVHDLRQGPW